ncbi:hypothetical protein QR721_13425 [Aciduricibacillus chroicocephali]|uniref:Uncharacterized protein n=1 Tax=Aciduricibacillus chroicocephali TaxID=3054939 RepID=A0ABY9KY45_9BACI|nr:hypothetical protein QR721_13425 [Bacillaceae bacterium 44XB]
MTVLFGSVEYFQEEIATNMTKEQLRNLSFGRSLEVVYSAIEYDLLYDFVCSETMREELLVNFEKAYEKVRSSLESVSLR